MHRKPSALSLAILLPLALAASAAYAGTLTVTVHADLTTLDLVATPSGGPFYIGGVIEDPKTGEQIGLFHCWGFFFPPDGLAVVNQEFDFTDRGKIILTGVEDNGPRAITGGTGQFRNVRGEAIGIDLSNFPTFPVTFRLIGASGR